MPCKARPREVGARAKAAEGTGATAKERCLLTRHRLLVREERTQSSATMAGHWRAMGQRRDVRHVSLPSLADAHSLCDYVFAMVPSAQPTTEGLTCAPWRSQ
eukprot:8334762-Pyramimonas_sp.AAC.1